MIQDDDDDEKDDKNSKKNIDEIGTINLPPGLPSEPFSLGP